MFNQNDFHHAVGITAKFDGTVKRNPLQTLI